MTTPTVHEIAPRRYFTTSDPAPRPLRHRYDPLTRDEVDAYRSRCAEIRALDRAADIARANGGAQS